jgi:hypothetical protein
MLESISLLEPLMPISNRELVDLATELIETAQRLNHSVHPFLRTELGKLERQAGTLQKKLIEAGLISADSKRSPFRLSFPMAIAERYFPALF